MTSMVDLSRVQSVARKYYVKHLNNIISAKRKRRNSRGEDNDWTPSASKSTFSPSASSEESSKRRKRRLPKVKNESDAVAFYR